MPNESFEIHGQKFDWDKHKNIQNIKKHGVPFKIAALAFFETDSVILSDEEHSQDEDRFILVGFSEKQRLLTVCHCYRDDGNVVRIISARKATTTEQYIYGGAV